MKVCSQCNKSLPLNEFYSRGKKREDLQSYCKHCLNLTQMIRWNQRKIDGIEYLGGLCMRCGESDLHPALYDFHHRNPENKDVGWNKLRLRAWNRIKQELDKCDLLCCKCHRLEHLNPELWPKYPRQDSNLQPVD